jgi:hypothetical protein
MELVTCIVRIYMTTDAGVPGSIPGHYKKKVVGSGTGCTQPREYN